MQLLCCGCCFGCEVLAAWGALAWLSCAEVVVWVRARSWAVVAGCAPRWGVELCGVAVVWW
jgi:hypothetical protein